MPTLPGARRLALALAVVAASGCRQPVQSQPQRVEAPAGGAASVGDEIGRSRETAITRAVRAVEPAVVSVSVTGVQRVQDPQYDPFWDFFGFGGQRRAVDQPVQSAGSGFVMSADGYVVTNQHVVGQNPTAIRVAFLDGVTREATLVGVDAASDLALLKVTADAPLPYLSFAQEATPIPGEWVIALGNPFGIFEAGEPSVSVGVVSAVNRNLNAEGEGRLYRGMVQTDAAINPGNSGGPLVNALGEVIGVNTVIYSRSGGYQGIGFAIPASRVRQVVDEIRETGTVQRAGYTGLNLTEVTPRIARVLSLTATTGVFVQSVDANSPAANAGLQAYDVITKVGAQTLAGGNDYLAALYERRPGDRVALEYLRDGETRRATLTLAPLNAR